MNLMISNETNFSIDEFVLDFENIIKLILSSENINTNIEVSLTFLNNSEIQEINKKFRKIDKPTDVLSFPLIEDFNIDFSEKVLIGDIIISIDKAIEQSKSFNHSIRRELCFLVAHSVYHLIGYDHMTPEDEKEMFEKQEETLNKLNIFR